MNDSELRWRDEILQLLYWMKGENMGNAVSTEQMNRFLALTPEQLRTTLEQLEETALIERTHGSGHVPFFRLTELGMAEGKRRFVDEFQPYLGKESHLECSEPDCECHSPEFTGICRNLEEPR